VAPIAAKIGELRRVIISNVVAYNVSDAILISGIKDHTIKDIEIKNIEILFQRQWYRSTRQNVKFLNWRKVILSLAHLAYYLLTVFMPASSMDIKLEDLELHFINNDERPAISNE
jgi:hypothetical protein